MNRRIIEWFNKSEHRIHIDFVALNRALAQLCDDFSLTPQRIAIHFISDEELYVMNMKHLQHDTYTDVITFPYSEPPVISGEIFVSTDRAEDNALQLMISAEEELARYCIHGLLHLAGYDDATTAEREEMRRIEDQYVLLYKSFT